MTTTRLRELTKKKWVSFTSCESLSKTYPFLSGSDIGMFLGFVVMLWKLIRGG